jgi:hypothetical protein
LQETGAESSDLFFMCWRCTRCWKGIEWHQCSMGIVVCCNRVSTNGLRGSEMVAQMWRVGRSQTSNWRKRYMHGVSLSPKLFILRAKIRLCVTGPSVSTNKGTTLKNYVLGRFLHLL